MTASFATLRQRMRTVRKQLDQERAPRSWCFILDEDEAIPAPALARIAASDTVCVRRIFANYLGELHSSNRCIGYAAWPGGSMIVRPGGSMERIVTR